MRKVWVMIILIIGLFEAGCSDSNEVMVRLHGDETIVLRSGHSFKVELNANPTTGYTWQVNTDKVSGLISEKVKSAYQRKNDLIGGGGIKIYTFYADGKGRGEIGFIYKRSWEDQAVKKYILKVIVE